MELAVFLFLCILIRSLDTSHAIASSEPSGYVTRYQKMSSSEFEINRTSMASEYDIQWNHGATNVNKTIMIPNIKATLIKLTLQTNPQKQSKRPESMQNQNPRKKLWPPGVEHCPTPYILPHCTNRLSWAVFDNYCPTMDSSRKLEEKTMQLVFLSIFNVPYMCRKIRCDEKSWKCSMFVLILP